MSRVLQDPRGAWRWLAGYLRAPEEMPPLYVGYGRGDQFGDGQALLASVIVPDRRFVVAGSHDWETWAQVCHEVFSSLPVATYAPSGETPRRAVSAHARHDDGRW